MKRRTGSCPDRPRGRRGNRERVAGGASVHRRFIRLRDSWRRGDTSGRRGARATSATSSCAGCWRAAAGCRVLDRLLFDHGHRARRRLLDEPALLVRARRPPRRGRRSSARSRASPTSSCSRPWSATRSAASTRSSPARVNDDGLQAAVRRLLGGRGIDRFVFTSTCSNYGLRESDEPATEESGAGAALALRRDQGRVRALRPRAGVGLGLLPDVAADRDRLRALPADAVRPDDLGVHPHAGDRRGARRLRRRHLAPVLPRRRHLAGDHDRAWTRPRPLSAGEVFNVGHSDENYTKRMVVDAVQAHLSGAGRVTLHRGRAATRATTACRSTRSATRLGFEAEHRVPETVGRLIDGDPGGRVRRCLRAARLLHQPHRHRRGRRAARSTRSRAERTDAGGDPRRRRGDAPAPVHDGAPEAADAGRRPSDPRADRAPARAARASRASICAWGTWAS